MNNIDKTTKQLRLLKLQAYIKAAQATCEKKAELHELVGDACNRMLKDINEPRWYLLIRSRRVL